MLITRGWLAAAYQVHSEAGYSADFHAAAATHTTAFYQQSCLRERCHSPLEILCPHSSLPGAAARSS